MTMVEPLYHINIACAMTSSSGIFTPPKPVVLCILDGWGVADPSNPSDAIAQANTPTMDYLMATYPHSQIATSGLAVGLPEGQMGNSEVGHMTIGSGRIMMQYLPRINQAIAEKSLEKNEDLQASLADLKQKGKTLHLLGLLSPGGVHAHQDHMLAVAKIANAHGVKTYLHCFTDGRDTPPGDVIDHIKNATKALELLPHASIATIGGRYFAMDRDHRWDRVQKAYDVIVSASSPEPAFTNPVDAAQAALNANVSDEFILPVAHADYHGIKDGDGVMMMNFRSDRAREILEALLLPEFNGFERAKTLSFSHQLGMVEYSELLTPHLRTLFPAITMKDALPEVLAKEGKRQLRIAETEKYGHVTFFFNGGTEAEYEGESRILVPSPSVATYDQQPQMSAPGVTSALVEHIENDPADVIIVNYANTDMVGHTGSFEAAVKAVEAVDEGLGMLFAAVKKAGGALLITADHGNAECMKDDHGNPHTAHTTGPVPCILAAEGFQGKALSDGRLCDLAPTVLKLLAIDIPSAMEGRPLF